MSGMGLGVGMAQVISQKLIMTPELRQAIKILELPTHELCAYIEQTALENPLLEVESTEEQVSLDSIPEEPDWASYFADRSDLGFVSRTGTVAEPPPEYPEPRHRESGYDNLLSQLSSEHNLSPKMIDMVKSLIWSLDNDGYLRTELSEVAAATGVNRSDLEHALDILHTFDPPGVGARDLRECLLLQARRLRIGTLVVQLIDKHLDDLAQGRFSLITSKLGCTEENLREAVHELRTLRPRPGLSSQLSADDGVTYIIPDVTVRRIGREWVCFSNDTGGPRLAVSSAYADMLRNGSADAETLTYIRRKFSDAVRLVKSVDQRRQTIIKVAAAIVKRQEDFMLAGQRFLLPMTLREIAEEVGIHESTVSRAVNGKYIDTPRGVFEMKWFFTSGVGTDVGEGTSSLGVKKRMGELVASELKSSPLTDTEIAKTLGKDGIRISRRTVAKYRDEMGIPPSTLRRMH